MAWGSLLLEGMAFWNSGECVAWPVCSFVGMAMKIRRRQWGWGQEPANEHFFSSVEGAATFLVSMEKGKTLGRAGHWAWAFLLTGREALWNTAMWEGQG